MTKEEFLELFSEVDKYGYRYNPLNEDHFCILYRVNTKEFSIEYNEDFEDYDGYTTETANGNLIVNFDIALKIYELDK